MELRQIKCPSCGQTTPIAESGEGFCLYCGAKLNAGSPKAAESIEEIRRIYRGYIEWVIKYFESTTAFSRTVASFFTGSNDFKRHENHGRFIEDVRTAAQNIEAAFASGTLSHEDAVELLHFTLLENHDQGISEAKWMFLAAEQFFEPLLTALTADEAAEFFEEYKRLRKKDPGFPVQQKILKTLKKMK